MPRRAAPPAAPYRVDLGPLARVGGGSPKQATPVALWRACGPGNGLVAQPSLARREHHPHLPALEPGLRCDLGNGHGLLIDALKQLDAKLHTRRLAAPEAQG